KNIFVSGGFSNIKNLEKRIVFEAQPFCFVDQPVNVMFAKDAIYDAFYGANLSHLFPTFDSDEFQEVGVERIVQRFEF
ncbi:MAG: hypothetical protein ACRC1D_07100, partial [Culicoidibacterales bacterium]